MKQDNKPLWQRLNEERTQGDWMVFKQEGLFPSIIMHGTEEQYIQSYGRNGFCMNVGGEESKIKANAKYTALAVNNLASLAEALEGLDNAAMCFADDYAHYLEKGDLGKINSMLADIHNAHLKAKEALNKIS